MAGDEATHWLRPAGVAETFFCQLQDAAGLLVSTYGLTLRTTQPLKDEHVQEALVHLFRKVPTLRLCFRQREGVLWVCDMEREHIDFKTVDTSDQLKVQEELMNRQFNNREGPLWCARLLQQNSCGGPTSPGLEAAFPHRRSLVLANHHGIADGTTNCRTVNVFLQILDDVIAGKHIDDSDQFGELASGEETEALMEAMEQELKKDEDLLNQTLEEIEKRHKVQKLIPRAFPHEEDPNYTTKIASAALDEETTAGLLRRCKQEGVTVNSGFVTVINGSLVDLVREAGVDQDTYPIAGLQAVNMRRYWQGDVSRALGCHVSVIEHNWVLPATWRDNFWQHARDLHQDIHGALKSQEPIKFMIYFLMDKGEDMITNMLKQRPDVENDQVFANIGNVDLLIPAEGEHVRLGHLVRTTQCWNDRVLHMCHSLRGRLLYDLCYVSDFLSEQQAARFVELILHNLKAVM